MRLPGRYDGVARPIVTYGSDPVLHRACAPVTEFGEDLRRLVLDMFASMSAADGVGLAANQIGVDARIFVIDCPDAEGEDVVGYVINPTLTLPGPSATSRSRKSPTRAACPCPARTRTCPEPSVLGWTASISRASR